MSIPTSKDRKMADFLYVGLINNVLYVIILSAALDLVGPNIPKGVVLLADVIPSFLTKLCAPYVIHAVPYAFRILIWVGFSVCGMLIIALSPSYADSPAISQKLAGVILASFSSGFGELSFLGLTHFYGPFSLAAWGSGTGGAGLIGAGAYALATTSLGFTVRTTLLASACLPAIMVISFFVILPRGPIKSAGPTLSVQSSAADEDFDHSYEEGEGLLAAEDSSKAMSNARKDVSAWENFLANLKRSRSLFFPLSVVRICIFLSLSLLTCASACYLYF
jgi:battenin